jgi:hypothetical protein
MIGKMPVKTITDRRKSSNLNVDFTLTGAIIAIVVVGNIFHRLSSYSRGLGRTNFYYTEILPLLVMACLGLIFFLLIVQLVQTCIKGYFLSIKGTLIRIFFTLISIFVIFTGFKVAKPGYISFTHGFKTRMQNEADINAIRMWLKTVEVKDEASCKIDEYEWPDCIKKLSPQYTFIEKSDNDEIQVRITWGWPVSHWGLIVGPATMNIPESDFRRYGEYRIKLEQGAYVWHEIK